MTITTDTAAERAVRDLAAGLARQSILARVSTSGSTALVEVEITTEDEYEVLSLAPHGADRIRWTTCTAYGDINGQGEWDIIPASRVPLLGSFLHHRAVADRIRLELDRWNARPGRPDPGTIEQLIGDEVSTWAGWSIVVTHAYAQAIVDGHAGADSTPEDLASIHPHLTTDYNLEAEEWNGAICILRQLADGRVAEDDEDHEPGTVLVITPLAKRFGPDAVSRLRTAFGGDLTAAATAFINRSPQ
ncbi:hypothetical protein [Kitasatospora kifunensis]|uniref:Uncharacterized protein n=1 Tax=Kitasatospora kifunensis TaxID=58351 RepID=A0A7W7W0C7_KITKI|nr:hypothetical protein [Kitasatospora kifunensis]MBB4929038.1 hypothetical protein [Kitasatospora kifunensis]